MAVHFVIFVMTLFSSATFAEVYRLPYNDEFIVIPPMSSPFSVELSTIHHLPHVADELEASSSWYPKCPPGFGKIPRLIPHPRNCRSLFVCTEGTPIEYFCPEGRVFSAEHQECTKQGTCNKENSNDLPAFETCPKDGREHLYPHPTDCNKFYQCVNTQGGERIGIPRPCPPNLHFHPKLKVCDYPRNVDCKARFFQLKP